MNRIAVSMNRGFSHVSVFIREIVRFDKCFCAALNRFVKSQIGIFNQKRNIAHTVAVLLDMFSRRMFGIQRCRQNKINAILPQNITRRFAVARFQSRIRDTRKPERLAIIKLRLLRIADVKLDVMYFFQT